MGAKIKHGIMKIEKKKISDLKPAKYNPRKSTQKQEENLKASLTKFGVVEPIVFNEKTGNIVGGHFRIRELKKLGHKEVDCVIVDLDEQDEKELNIRLNANTGEWDWDMLANEWDSEQLEEWGLDIPNWAEGVDENNMTEDDINIEDEFEETFIKSDKFKVGFMFTDKDSAESYLKSINVNPNKRGQIWTVDLSIQST